MRDISSHENIAETIAEIKTDTAHKVIASQRLI